MIAVIAAVIGGLIAGIKTPLFSPALYLAKSKKDLFLILFFFYSLSLGYEIEMSSVYYGSSIPVFTIILPAVLVLDSGLRGMDKDLVQYIFIAPMLIGLLLKEMFIVGITLTLLYHFYRDHPSRGVVFVLISVFLLITALFLGEGALNLLGGSSSQVVFISAIGVFTALIFRLVNRTKIKLQRFV